MRPIAMAVVFSVLSIFTGCASDPGSITQGEVETKLKDTLNLKAVNLAGRPAGGYEGTGQAADGRNYTIIVEQKEAGRSLWYSARSDKGELKAGGFKDFGPSWLRPITQARNGILAFFGVALVVAVGIGLARKVAPRTKHPGQ